VLEMYSDSAGIISHDFLSWLGIEARAT